MEFNLLQIMSHHYHGKETKTEPMIMKPMPIIIFTEIFSFKMRYERSIVQIYVRDVRGRTTEYSKYRKTHIFRTADAT